MFLLYAVLPAGGIRGEAVRSTASKLGMRFLLAGNWTPSEGTADGIAGMGGIACWTAWGTAGAEGMA
jgi:hypothetical protein